MQNNDLIRAVVDYVRTKSQQFLEKNELGDVYSIIVDEANNKSLSVTDYIDFVLNETVRVVAESRKSDWGIVKDEFIIFYLSK